MTGKGPVERPEQSCEGVLGGAGDVACSLRNTRKASIAWEFQAAWNVACDTSFRSHRNLLTGSIQRISAVIDAATCLRVSLTGEQSIYRDGKLE